jgi:hypothetical protein
MTKSSSSSKCRAIGMDEPSTIPITFSALPRAPSLRVRFPPLDDSGLAMRALSDSSQRLVASPALLARFPDVLAPADLALLPTADWGPAGREHVWRLRGPAGAAVFPSRRGLLPAVRGLLDFLVAEFKELADAEVAMTKAASPAPASASPVPTKPGKSRRASG